jgi:stage V sporulation protein R
MTKPLYTGSEWDVALIEKMWKAIDHLAKTKFKLDYYPPHLEIITAEQMLDNYSSVAMPIMYSHWSFGKTFLQNEREYNKGIQGLAYEVVINTNPCIAYLMENNTATLMALVLAHASCVDADTECLTEDGWIKISEYDGQKIAQYSEEGTVVFKHPVRYIETKTDKFYELKARGVSQKVTPDHTMVFKDGKGNLRKESADQFVERHSSKTRGHLGRFITHFRKGEHTNYGISGDKLRLHVAIKADGSRQGQKYRFHLKKDRKITRLEQLLQSLDISYDKVDTYGGRVSIRFTYPEIAKEYTWEEYMQWGQIHLEIVGEEVLYWDGSVGSNNFSSTIKQSADIIQLVWASIGYGTTIYKYVSEGKQDCYSVRRGAYAERSLSRSRGGVPNEIVQTAGGKAYCFTTDTGMWIARREDNIFVTGNCGHSSFFKNNYLFKGWTDAESIIDYLKFARGYIKSCEEKYGASRVETLLDCCHSLQSHGVDKYKKPTKLSSELNRQRKKQWENYSETTFNDIWRTLPKKTKEKVKPNEDIHEENLLYFVEKHSPVLKEWEREIVRIVRKIAQYFYPQRQTQLLNEGWATFCHHMLMTEMHEQGLIDEGSYLEFLQSHTNVVAQRDWDSKYYRGINVYALGFAMLTDIKRACIAPDEEDLKWLPSVCNTPWLDTIKDIVENYRDESFVMQFLSPKVARHFKLFSFHIKEKTPYLAVNATHDDDDFLQIRKALAEQYDMSRSVPQIEIVEVDWEGDRVMYLEHITKNNQRLNYRDVKKTLDNLSYLWGFPVIISYVDLDGCELEDVA